MHRDAAKRTCRAGISTRSGGIWNASVMRGHHGLSELSLQPSPSRTTRRRGASVLPDVLLVLQGDVAESCRRIAVTSRVSRACRSATIVTHARPIEHTRVRRTKFLRPWLVAIYTGFFRKHLSMTPSLRTSPPLPLILATAILVGLAGTASGAPHPKRHAAAHRPKPAAST